MQMRRWRRFGAVLVLTVCALATSPAVVRAEAEIPPGAKVTKIGPQEVVIEHPDGQISQYDDPSERARECDSPAACAGKAISAFGLFSALVYEELTTNVEGSGRPAGSNGGGGAE